jgi:hypothetical protein
MFCIRATLVVPHIIKNTLGFTGYGKTLFLKGTGFKPVRN